MMIIDQNSIIELDLNRAKIKERDGDYKGAERIYKDILKMNISEEIKDQINNKLIEFPSRNKKSNHEEERRDDQPYTDFKFKVYDKRFNDVIGFFNIKKKIVRTIEMPNKKAGFFTRFGVAKSSGILFYGPPGTGKTQLVKAASGQFKMKMVDVKLSEIIDKKVGEAEKKLKILFEQAVDNQPCIIFFDEIDAIGMSRDKTSSEGTGGELRTVITEFLKQVSELHDNKENQVFIIGATNLPWDVDLALRRSGRIENPIYIKAPDFWDRRALFKYYLDYGKQTYAKVNYSMLSIATYRYSPADIEKVVKAAKLNMIDTNPNGIITTRSIQRVLKDRNIGASSLDEWYLTTKNKYLTNKEKIKKKEGFWGMLGFSRTEIIEKEGKFTKGDRETYKEMINDVNMQIRYWWIFNGLRFIGQGI